MNLYLPVINAFIEDTCVLMVIAYLLARGRMLTLLISERATNHHVWTLGVILGLVGLTEAIFPGLRSPYVLHTLIITFATLICGLRVGLIAVGTVLLGVSLLQTAPGVLETALTLTVAALITETVCRVFHARYRLGHGLIAGVCVQSGVVLLHQLSLAGVHTAHTITYALVTIPANGFGVLLLLLLLNDARMRAGSEQNRLEAERMHALVAESHLVALRARVHPHFLFNALTSIAALCSLAPDRAEASVLRLSQLMRRALEFNASTPLCLSEEIEYVQGYIEIESYRFGSRMQVIWEIDPAVAHVQIPAFSLQTLVENAVGHGIAPKVGAGNIHIIARARTNHVLIAVRDNGVGMKIGKNLGKKCTVQGKENIIQDRAHGLEIANAQLRLQYGRRARLRLFSREDQGTLAAFTIPLAVNPILCLHQKEITDADRSDCG